jgi:transcriptional regulator with XRE-family HTH domain
MVLNCGLQVGILVADAPQKFVIGLFATGLDVAPERGILAGKLDIVKAERFLVFENYIFDYHTKYNKCCLTLSQYPSMRNKEIYFVIIEHYSSILYLPFNQIVFIVCIDYRSNCSHNEVKMEETIGQKLKKLREAAGLSKAELARRAGDITREYIYQIESGRAPGNITVDKVESLARGLGVSPNVFFNDESTYTPLSEKLRLNDVVAYPVYTEFPHHAGEDAVEPLDYIYRRANKEAGKQIECYIVRGTCLEPVVYDGDTIIVDRDGSIDNGDIVACMLDGELHIAKLKKYDGELWMENNHGRRKLQDCGASAVVIEVIRRLK